MESKYYVKTRGKIYGPFPKVKLRDGVANGNLSPTDLIRKENGSKWIRATNISGLFDTNSMSESNNISPVSTPIVQLEPENTKEESRIIFRIKKSHTTVRRSALLLKLTIALWWCIGLVSCFAAIPLGYGGIYVVALFTNTIYDEVPGIHAVLAATTCVLLWLFIVYCITRLIAKRFTKRSRDTLCQAQDTLTECVREIEQVAPKWVSSMGGTATLLDYDLLKNELRLMRESSKSQVTDDSSRWVTPKILANAVNRVRDIVKTMRQSND